MSANSGWTRDEFVRKVHEILFSFNIAFNGVSVLFLAFPVLAVPFIRMDVKVNRVVHLRQTDLVRGYFEFLIAAALLAFCFWLALRLSSRTKFTAEVLRSAAGIATTFALPAFWLYVSQQGGWSLGWPYMAWPLELAIALCCILLFLYQRLPLPGWFWAILIAAHYGFWFWTRGNAFLANAAGPIAPMLGLSSTLIWGAHVNTLRQPPVSQSSPLRRSEMPNM
jgi:hypothetical protein